MRETRQCLGLQATKRELISRKAKEAAANLEALGEYGDCQVTFVCSQLLQR